MYQTGSGHFPRLFDFVSTKIFVLVSKIGVNKARFGKTFVDFLQWSAAIRQTLLMNFGDAKISYSNKVGVGLLDLLRVENWCEMGLKFSLSSYKTQI